MKRFIKKHLAESFGITYILGVILYTIGFWEGASSNLFTALLRAMLASLEMFAAHSELVEVSEALKEGSVFYMVCFAAVHFIAVLLSLIFIIDIFGKRLYSRFVTWCWSLGKDDPRKLIIIDGTDENCLTMARSIPADKNNKVVFIKGAVDSNVKAFSLSEIFISGMKLNNDEDLEKYGTILYTNLQLSTSIVQGKGWIGNRVMKLMKVFRSTEVFFLEWDSNNNSTAAYMLSKALDKDLDVTIHAGVNTAKPHAAKLAGQDNIISINRSQLVADDLLENTPLMKEGFGRKTLVLGFGHTAKLCIRKLADAGFKELDIMDPETAGSREEFLCFNPQLREMAGIRYYDFRTRDNGFWSYLRENICSLDNIVIFSHDDVENYNLARKVLNYAETAREDISDLRIYIMELGPVPGDDADHMFTFGRRNAIYNYAKF